MGNEGPNYRHLLLDTIHPLVVTVAHNINCRCGKKF